MGAGILSFGCLDFDGPAGTRNQDLLSPAFSKKSGGTLFLVFRGAWRVVHGAWF